MRKNTWLKTAICLLLAAALWACNTGSDEAPRERRFTDLGPSLEADRARLEAARDAVAKDTLHDSATVAAWAATLDSLAAELNDIEHDFRIVGPRPEGAPNRERDREAALAAGLRAFEERFAGTAPNRVPEGYRAGPAIKLGDLPVGNIAIRIFGGTSTTTEWPPNPLTGDVPETLMVKATDKISLHLKTRSTQDWHLSVFDANSIPMLDTAAVKHFAFAAKDSIFLTAGDFASLAGRAGSDGKYTFNLLVEFRSDSLKEDRVVLITRMIYDTAAKVFAPMDTFFDEQLLNYTGAAKLSYLVSGPPGDSLRTFLFIPGSYFFLEADTLDFKSFHIPNGNFQFRMLAVPRNLEPDQEALGWIYDMVTDTEEGVIHKVFYPVGVSDSLRIKGSMLPLPR